MGMDPDGGIDVQVSALSPPDRLDAVRTFMRGWRLPMDLHPHRPLDISARSSVSDFGDVCLLSTAGSGATTVRTDRMARDDTPPQLVISVLGAGTSVVTQHERAAHLRPGDLVVHLSTAPFRITFPAGTARHSLMIPVGDVALSGRVLSDLVARPFGPGDPLTRVVSSYLLRIAATAPSMSARSREVITEPTTTLVRAFLASVAADDSAYDALGAGLSTRVLEYLRSNFADRGLSAARIAAVHGISERHLHTVLTHAGIALRPWLRERRLAAAARMLAGPTGRQLSIAAVAHTWGFADHAHFTREFRKRYGTTPSEWRQR